MNKLGKFIVCGALAVGLCPLGGCAVVWELKGVNTDFTEAGTGITSVHIDYDHANLSVRFDEHAEKVTVSYPALYNHRAEAISQISLEETETSVTLLEDDGGIADAGFKIGEYELPTLTLTLPSDRVYDLALSTSYGEIVMQGKGAFGALAIVTKNGEIRAETVTLVGETASFVTGRGGIRMGEVAAETVNLQTKTGAISVEKTITAKELFITTDHGEIKTLRGVAVEKAAFTTRIGAINALLIGKATDYTVEIASGTLTGETPSAGESDLHFVTLKTMVGVIEVDFKE